MALLLCCPVEFRVGLCLSNGFTCAGFCCTHVARPGIIIRLMAEGVTLSTRPPTPKEMDLQGTLHDALTRLESPCLLRPTFYADAARRPASLELEAGWPPTSPPQVPWRIGSRSKASL